MLGFCIAGQFFQYDTARIFQCPGQHIDHKAQGQLLICPDEPEIHPVLLLLIIP